MFGKESTCSLHRQEYSNPPHSSSTSSSCNLTLLLAHRLAFHQTFRWETSQLWWMLENVLDNNNVLSDLHIQSSFLIQWGRKPYQIIKVMTSRNFIRSYDYLALYLIVIMFLWGLRWVQTISSTLFMKLKLYVPLYVSFTFCFFFIYVFYFLIDLTSIRWLWVCWWWRSLRVVVVLVVTVIVGGGTDVVNGGVLWERWWKWWYVTAVVVEVVIMVLTIVVYCGNSGGNGYVVW